MNFRTRNGMVPIRKAASIRFTPVLCDRLAVTQPPPRLAALSRSVDHHRERERQDSFTHDH